jgi:rhodanese-related sulfurtransferase
MRKGQLLDLRHHRAHEAEAIKGARSFSMRELLKKNQAKIRKDLSVYLYHSTPFKAKRAAKKLVIRGFKEVYYLNAHYPQKNGR